MVAYPHFVDLEASGLRWSGFPIKAAWNNPNGSIHSLLIAPMLIADWDDLYTDLCPSLNQ